MPRIDPLQLLKCLSVLLTPEGGILSRDEVPRLVNLMTKFSKKLVSKCVYVLILKNTENELVDMFMAEGGWTLIQTWLQDAVQTCNWDLVKEILGLLLITPVDVERLKLNILPKLIKSLSRRDELEGVSQLSTQLVQQWLVIVKGSSSVSSQQVSSEPQKVEIPHPESDPVIESALEAATQESDDSKSDAISTESFYKTNEKSADTQKAESEGSLEASDTSKGDNKSRSKSSKDSKTSRDKSRDKYREKDRYRDKDRRKTGSSSKSSKSRGSDDERERKRSKTDKDKDKYRANGSSKSSSRYKEDKDRKKEAEKQSDKDKDTLASIKPPTIDKLGRIPKKSAGAPGPPVLQELRDKKKAFSIGIRKDAEERPKTVKIFNSKMRSTGLEEEIKSGPARPGKKPTPSIQLPTIPTKRPSPLRDSIVPPEKKLKLDKVDVPERPGAIKLIPPKPKPVLQESDLFMDALTAATTKKEPKKKKRRPSVTKDVPTSPASSPRSEPPTTPTQTVSTSPLGLKNIAPINFYQDTLSEDVAEIKDEENKENSDAKEDKEALASPRSATPTDTSKAEDLVETKRPILEGGLRGVLLYSKKKGPKRSISWKAEEELVEVRFFELDETERVNVTKTFGDMAKMDISSEREALEHSRKLGGDDMMEAQVLWRIPFLLDQEDPLAAPGHKSLEKDIQFAREKSVLQALYFDKRRIPDSAEEPVPENYQMSDPVAIPLEDPESQEIDLRLTPWPESKGQQPIPEPQAPTAVFPNIQGPFNPAFNSLPPPVGFQAMPARFPAPTGPLPVPNNFVNPNMMPNGGLMPPMGPPNMGPPSEMLMNHQMNPNMFPMPDNFAPMPDYPMFPGPNNMNNMFPPNNFNGHRHNRGGGGGFRRGRDGNNGGNWVRMGGGGNWRRGGGGRGGRLCKNIQNHGYCRNGDNCPFVHP